MRTRTWEEFRSKDRDAAIARIRTLAENEPGTIHCTVLGEALAAAANALEEVSAARASSDSGFRFMAFPRTSSIRSAPFQRRLLGRRAARGGAP